MSRKGSIAKREITPDVRYGSVVVAKFIHAVMLQGKKSIAEKLVYEAFHIVKNKTKQEGVEVFLQALENVKPTLEVRSRRIGGATYQVPVDVSHVRSSSLAFRWLVGCARKRSEHSMEERLAGELIDAFNNKGGAVKLREEKRKMAEANRAFSHFKW